MDTIEYKTMTDIAREEGLEEMLLQLDIVQFAGATKVRGVGDDGRVTYKLVVGVRKQFAHIASMALGAALQQVKWAEAEDVALDLLIVQGRARN